MYLLRFTVGRLKTEEVNNKRETQSRYYNQPDNRLQSIQPYHNIIYMKYICTTNTILYSILTTLGLVSSVWCLTKVVTESQDRSVWFTFLSLSSSMYDVAR